MEKLGQLVQDWQIAKREVYMSKKFIKSEPGYDSVEFDEKKVVEGSKNINRKMPTSVSLSPETVAELKLIAVKKGIPYQVLMRSFILEGLEKIKKSA